MTMELRTMCHWTSVLAVPLDRALESLTFGDCRSIDLVACLEDICLDFLCKFIFSCILKLEFSYESLS